MSRVFFSDGSSQPVEATVALPENWTNEFIVTTVPSAAETGPVWIETPTGVTDSITFTVVQAATASSSSTEQQYAGIDTDASIQSFNGATGSQTIAGSTGAGGVPFFNHEAIAYVDANGVAHVVIIGGNDMNDPATPVARV